MGKVVKGAQVTQKTYQLKTPPTAAQRAATSAPLDDEDPRFSQLHAAPASDDAFEQFEASGPAPVDLDAARAEATKLIDDASADAEALLRDAQTRALSLIDDAERRSGELREQAHTEGFDQGVSDGRAAAQAEMDEMLETMRGLIEMARVERHKIIESAEPEIVRLSVTIAERIVNAHVSSEPEAIIEMVRGAITRLVNRETVTVRVNPADIEAMRQHRDQFMSMNDIDNMRIIEDQRVDRGGVVIETDAGTIDAKVSTQLREVRRLLAVDDTLSVTPSNEPAIINPPAQAS